MKQLYSALVTNGISFECLGDEELGLKEGDAVVVLCERYTDYAIVTKKIGEPIANVEEFERQKSLASKGRHIEGDKTPVIIRKATPEDEAKVKENKFRAVTAHGQTRERIQAHNLEMKLIHTHYSLDCKLLLFQFSADGRIDFRELLRDLSTLFRARIELRQVGVRDEAAVLGGIGICGLPFCCSKFLHTFNSINVKMAKQQGISLNPQNISGCCGRLKCCLYYEADAYKDVAVSVRDKSSMLKVDEVDEKELELLDEKENEDQNNSSERQQGRRNSDNRQNRDGQQRGGEGQRPRDNRQNRDGQQRDNRQNREGRGPNGQQPNNRGDSRRHNDRSRNQK